MPNINIREGQVQPGQAPRPVEGGAAAYEMEGRHVESAYAQAGAEIGGAISQVGGQYVQHEERLDAIDQANYFAHKQEAITQRLTAAKLTNDPSDPNYLDPHDPNAVVKMLDGLDQSDDDFQGKTRTVNGQASFARQNAEFRSTAFRQATVEQADMAAKDITNKFNNTVNTYMATAYQDPMAAKDILPQLDSLRRILPAGSDSEVDRAKQEVANQAAKSMIDNSADPLKAFQQAKATFGEDIGPHMGELQDHSIAMDRARRQDVEMQHTLFKQAQSDRSEAQAQKYLNVMGQNGGTLPAGSAASIMTDNNLLPSMKITLFDLQKRAAETKIPQNPALVSNLISRLALPETDPRHPSDNEIYSKIDVDGGMTQSEGAFVLSAAHAPDKQIRGQAMTAMDARIEAALNPKNGFNFGTSSGAANAADARLSALQAIQDGERQGWSWSSMMLPGGQHYILTQKFFDHFKGTSAGSFSALVGPNQPAPTAGPKPSLDDIFQGK